MRDFVYGYYGEAAEPIWQYQERLWRLWEHYHQQPGKTPEENPLLADIRYAPDNPVIAGDFPDAALALFAQAETLARDPETLRRVKLAKVSVLYVALCQGVGYLDGGQLHFGKRNRGAAAHPQSDAVYRGYLAELTETIEQEKITHFAEGAPDAAQKLQTWRELLATELPKVDFQEIGNAWRFKPDPGDAGMKEGWFAPETDDQGWAEVRSDRGNGWESQGFPGYLGYGWYRQRVQMPADLAQAQRCYLLFGAVDEDAEVFINGRKAFTHTCASTGLTPSEIWIKPFVFDPRPFLQSGENLIAVRVHNGLGMGGIWKPVWFVATDKEADPRLMLAVIQLRQQP
jgi:hypothetical protein